MSSFEIQEAEAQLYRPHEGLFFVVSAPEEVAPLARDIASQLALREDAVSWVHNLRPEETVHTLADSLFSQASARLLAKRGADSFSAYLDAMDHTGKEWWGQVTAQWGKNRQKSTEVALLAHPESGGILYPAVVISAVTQEASQARRLADAFNVGFYSNFRALGTWVGRRNDFFPISTVFVIDEHTKNIALSERSLGGSLWRLDRMRIHFVE